MLKRYGIAALTAAVVIGVLLFGSSDSGPQTRSQNVQTAAERTISGGRTSSLHADDSAPEKVGVKKTQVSSRERERYRNAIRTALADRDPPTQDAVPRPTPSDEPNEGSASAPLKDRSDGKLAGLMKDFQDDVMPLADECYEQALERDPSLAGGLDMQFEIIGDEDVGGLVESLELQESSDIRDAEMVECIRETLLSTIFPAPEDSGTAEIRLTLRFSADE